MSEGRLVKIFNMARKRTEHCVMSNEGMLCTNCGARQPVPMPIDARMFSAMTDAFIKIHKNCIKTWTPPVHNPSDSEFARAMWWLKHGEHGTSSITMFKHLSGIKDWQNLPFKQSPEYDGHPLDIDDFQRCYKLLKVLPEWRTRISQMKAVSPEWSNLSDNWDTLTALFEEAMDTKEDNGLHALIKKCINQTQS